MNAHLKKVHSKAPHMLFFSLLFMIIGWFVHFAYFNFLDNTVYFKYNSVATNKEEYELCEQISLEFDRNSLINTDGHLIVQLYEKDDHRIVHQREAFDISIFQGERQYSDKTFYLPCNLCPSTYYYEGLLTFDVKGVKKVVTFTTNDFTIK